MKKPRTLVRSPAAVARQEGDMSERFFELAAQEEARRHYGMILDEDAILNVLRACRDGRATFMYAAKRGSVFLWRHRGRFLLPVTTSDRGMLVGFEEPKGAFAA